MNHSMLSQWTGTLLKVFPIHPKPCGIEVLCASFQGTEGPEEVAAFDGLEWPQVEPELLLNYYSAVSFFTPIAFHYFLPAIVRCSFLDFRRTATALSNIVHSLTCPLSFDGDSEMRSGRWKMFEPAQLQVIALWFKELHAERGDIWVPEGELLIASNAVQLRVWLEWGTGKPEK